MWEEICNVHQRHTLLDKLAARRDFYTAATKQGEKMLVYINRVRQMASVLESMGVTIDDKEKAMAVLNGLPKRFETISTALDAIGDDDPSFTFDKVRSRLLQEEKRSAIKSVADSCRRRRGLRCDRRPLASLKHPHFSIEALKRQKRQTRSYVLTAARRTTPSRTAGRNTVGSYRSKVGERVRPFW